MAKWPGKKFEQDFTRQAEEDPGIFVYRCRDVQWYAGSVNIADFLLYNWNTLASLELKSTKGKSVPFSRLNKTQRLMMLAENVIEIIWYVFNFRWDVNKTYFVDVFKVSDYIEKAERKSIPLDWIQDNGWLIPQTLRQTRYDYDLSILFE